MQKHMMGKGNYIFIICLLISNLHGFNLLDSYICTSFTRGQRGGGYQVICNEQLF